MISGSFSCRLIVKILIFRLQTLWRSRDRPLTLTIWRIELCGMGAFPKSGQERSQLRCICIAGSLVQLFLFLTIFCIFYVQVSLVPKSVRPSGIQWLEFQAMKLNSLRADPRGAFHETSRSVRRRLLYGKGHFYKQQFGSLAFGGRGVGLLHNEHPYQ